jgi:hypothetical protein
MVVVMSGVFTQILTTGKTDVGLHRGIRIVFSGIISKYVSIQSYSETCTADIASPYYFGSLPSSSSRPNFFKSTANRSVSTVLSVGPSYPGGGSAHSGNPVS